MVHAVVSRGGWGLAQVLRVLLVLGSVHCAPVGCASEPARASTTLPVPRARHARARALDRAGARIFQALQHARPTTLLLDDRALTALLSPEAASRASALRLTTESRITAVLPMLGQLRGFRYLGICVQNSRLERGGSVLGLARPAWVFDRALVAGADGAGGRIASWVEGIFVFTDVGFQAVDLEGVEAPRPDHSDLELAPCDMEVGLTRPRPVGEVAR